MSRNDTNRQELNEQAFSHLCLAQALLLAKENAIGPPLADALQLLPQAIYVNQTLSGVLLQMDMFVEIALIEQSVELRSGLISEASCSLANRH